MRIENNQVISMLDRVQKSINELAFDLGGNITIHRISFTNSESHFGYTAEVTCLVEKDTCFRIIDITVP